MLKKLFFLLTLIILVACHGPNKSITTEPAVTDPISMKEPGEQIGKYLVEIFEDQDGVLWFGTLSKGVARYDGDTLIYLTVFDGLPNNAVVSIEQDKSGTMWFGTHGGLAKYDGKNFTHFMNLDGEESNRVSSIFIDSKDNFWVNSWAGVYHFDGDKLSAFPLPLPEIELLPYQTTMAWMTAIMEDSQGNMWFGRDGYGACKYDGKNFTHFTEKDGLQSNNVQEIHEDKEGRMWFGTRVAERDHPEPEMRKGAGGLSRYKNGRIEYFPEIAGFNESDVYLIYTDKSDNLWISTLDQGVYKFDGEKFTNYKPAPDAEGPAFVGIQSMLEDSNGNMWFGCSGGLFRLDDEEVINITTTGPWD